MKATLHDFWKWIKRLWKKPWKHGGRRGPKHPSPGQGHRPELICRETTDRSWEIVVTGGKQAQLISISQNSHALIIQGGECIIPSFTGTLKVSYQDEAGKQRFVRSPLSGAKKGGTRTMIFKFPADWKGEGRKVTRLTGGHYIVIAPEEFERLGEPPPVEHSPCRDEGFIAHYFHRSKGSGEAVEFKAPAPTPPTSKWWKGSGEAKKETLKTDEPCFDLKGNVVFDDSPEGQLFVGAVPELKLTTPDNISWVRVGEERKGGWKGENFNPAEKSLAEVLGDRQGRFFIRAYDKDVAMIDGGEFRYFRDLREIRMNDEPYTEPKTSLPGPDGHAATEITFAGAEGATLKAETKSPSAEAQGAGITARPSADGDCIKCKLSSGKNSVDIVLFLRRVWWRSECSETQPGEWRAVPEVVTRERFRNLALAKATMRLRLPPEINAVFVGLDEKTDRKYPCDGDTKDFHVPLRDFIDYQQIDDQQYGQVSLNARFNDKDGDKTFPFLHVCDLEPTSPRGEAVGKGGKERQGAHTAGGAGHKRKGHRRSKTSPIQAHSPKRGGGAVIRPVKRTPPPEHGGGAVIRPVPLAHSYVCKDLGYFFQDLDLLLAALGDRFGKHDREAQGPLRQLGNTLLRLFIADELFTRLPETPVNRLIELRSSLANQTQLAQLAQNLSPHLRLSHSEDKSGKNRKAKLLADAVEALVGAVYLDSKRNVTECRAVALRLYAPDLDAVIKREKGKQNKPAADGAGHDSKKPHRRKIDPERARSYAREKLGYSFRKQDWLLVALGGRSGKGRLGYLGNALLHLLIADEDKLRTSWPKTLGGKIANLEALVGAVYLDSKRSVKECRAVVLRLFHLGAAMAEQQAGRGTLGRIDNATGGAPPASRGVAPLTNDEENRATRAATRSSPNSK